MRFQDMPWVQAMLPDDDELAYGLEEFSGKLDSYQAGAVGESGVGTPFGITGQQPRMSPQDMYSQAPDMTGQMAGGQPSSTGMPEAYTENRMQRYGMPQFAQNIESKYDTHRANNWSDDLTDSMLKHPADSPEAIEVDEIQMRTAGGDPQMAYEGSGNKAARIGNAVRGVADWYTGGGSKIFDWMKRG